MKSRIARWGLACLALGLAGSVWGEDAARTQLEELRAREYWRPETGGRSRVKTGAAALEAARGKGLSFDEDPAAGGLAYRWEQGIVTPGEDPTTLPAVVEEMGAYWRIERWALLPTTNETNRNPFNHRHRELRQTAAWFHLRELVGRDGTVTLLSAERRDRPGDWEERRLEAILAGVAERARLEWERSINGRVERSNRGIGGEAEDCPPEPYALDLGMPDVERTPYLRHQPRVLHVPMLPHEKNLPMTAAEREEEVAAKLLEVLIAAGDLSTKEAREVLPDLDISGRTVARTRAGDVVSGVMENNRLMRFRKMAGAERYLLTLEGDTVERALVGMKNLEEWESHYATSRTISEAGWQRAVREQPGKVFTQNPGDERWRRQKGVGWEAAGIQVHVTVEAGVRVGIR
jgi:hypothetical protein